MSHQTRTGARLVLGGLVLVFAFTALFVTAFHAPRPHHIDVGVVGSPAQQRQVQEALDAVAPGGFDAHRYRTERQARHALLDTTLRGVLVATPAGDRVLVAGALGLAPAQSVATALRTVAGRPARVEDLRSLPARDGRGLSALFTIVGTLMPSLLLGILLALVGGSLSARTRIAAVLVYGLLAGLLIAFNADVVVGAFSGGFAGIAVVTGMCALAVSASAHALGRLGGPAGVAVAVLTLLVVGISSSGGAVTPDFQPGFYRAVSSLLPPGAALTALRDAHYFGWSGTLAPLLVLGAWAAGGLAVGLAADLRRPRREAA